MQQSTLFKQLMKSKISSRIQYAELESYNQEMLDKYGDIIPTKLTISPRCLLPVNILIERLKTLEISDNQFFIDSFNVNSTKHIGVWYEKLPPDNHPIWSSHSDRETIINRIFNYAILCGNEKLYLNLFSDGMVPWLQSLAYAIAANNLEILNMMIETYKLVPDQKILDVAAQFGNDVLVKRFMDDFNLRPISSTLKAAKQSDNDNLYEQLKQLRKQHHSGEQVEQRKGRTLSL